MVHHLVKWFTHVELPVGVGLTIEPAPTEPITALDAGLGLVEGAHKEGTSKHSGCVTAQWSRKNVSLGHENGLQIILLGRSKNIRRRW